MIDASPNRAYLASLRFAQIPLRGTSDMPETVRQHGPELKRGLWRWKNVQC
jgi:hypothetical protein